jgi:hypothetical protein
VEGGTWASAGERVPSTSELRTSSAPRRAKERRAKRRDAGTELAPGLQVHDATKCRLPGTTPSLNLLVLEATRVDLGAVCARFRPYPPSFSKATKANQELSLWRGRRAGNQSPQGSDCNARLLVPRRAVAYSSTTPEVSSCEDRHLRPSPANGFTPSLSSHLPRHYRDAQDAQTVAMTGTCAGACLGRGGTRREQMEVVKRAYIARLAV